MNQSENDADLLKDIQAKLSSLNDIEEDNGTSVFFLGINRKPQEEDTAEINVHVSGNLQAIIEAICDASERNTGLKMIVLSSCMKILGQKSPAMGIFLGKVIADEVLSTRDRASENTCNCDKCKQRRAEKLKDSNIN